jgi:hypothetical protein
VQPGATVTVSLFSLLEYVPGDTTGIVGAVLRIPQMPGPFLIYNGSTDLDSHGSSHFTAETGVDTISTAGNGSETNVFEDAAVGSSLWGWGARRRDP